MAGVSKDTEGPNSRRRCGGGSTDSSLAVKQGPGGAGTPHPGICLRKVKVHVHAEARAHVFTAAGFAVAPRVSGYARWALLDCRCPGSVDTCPWTGVSAAVAREGPSHLVSGINQREHPPRGRSLCGP